MFRRSRYQFLVYFAIGLAPIILLSITAVLAYLKKNPDILRIASFLPYSLFAVVAFLGIRLNQSRIFFVSTTFAFTFYLITAQKLPSFMNITGLQLSQCLALGLPLSITLIYALGEGKRWGLRNLFRLILVLAPFSLLIAGAKLGHPFYKEIVNFDFLSDRSLFIARFWDLPDATVIVVSLYIITIPILKDYYLRSFNFAVLATFIPILYAFNKQGALTHASLSFAVAGAILQYAIFHLYWQKVYIDELTRIPNRRALDEQLRALGREYAIAMTDIDHFKKFNDTYGHEEGDNVLRMVAAHLASESSFRAFRYGGEEFCLVYEGNQATDVQPQVDKIRRKLAERPFYIRAPHTVRGKSSKKDRGTKHRTRTKVRVTISIGVASPNKVHSSPEQVISAADKALYGAKGKGRNCVVLSK